MNILIPAIEFVFSMGLFINTLLFFPQIIAIVKAKSAEGVSIIMFSGFWLIQLATVLHGIINHDPLLIGGYLLAMIPCGAIICLAMIYKRPKRAVTIVEERLNVLQSDESN